MPFAEPPEESLMIAQFAVVIGHPIQLLQPAVVPGRVNVRLTTGLSQNTAEQLPVTQHLDPRAAVFRSERSQRLQVPAVSVGYHTARIVDTLNGLPVSSEEGIHQLERLRRVERQHLVLDRLDKIAELSGKPEALLVVHKARRSPQPADPPLKRRPQGVRVAFRTNNLTRRSMSRSSPARSTSSAASRSGPSLAKLTSSSGRSSPTESLLHGKADMNTTRPWKHHPGTPALVYAAQSGA